MSSGLHQLGQYILLKKLGEGGMGSVYLADDTLAQRKVAIKVLSKKLAENAEFVERFQREARAMGKLNHPNIVAAFAVDEQDGHHYCVMEFCRGQSLDRMLSAGKGLNEGEALRIAVDIARGLEHAHSHGIVHRDIKPANVIVSSDGMARILDLGLSKSIAESENTFQTQAGVALGTPHYISPEQARGAANIDGRADIYSLGATLYHVLTGKTPYTGANANAVMLMHLSEPAPDPRAIRPELSAGVAQVIARMMAKDPAARYASCSELLSDLERVKSGRMPAGDPGSGSPQFALKKRKEHSEASREARHVSSEPQRKSSGTSPWLVVAPACMAMAGLLYFMSGSRQQQTVALETSGRRPEAEKRALEPEKSTPEPEKRTPLPEPRRLIAAEHRTSQPVLEGAPKAQGAGEAKQQFREPGINLLDRVDPARDSVSGNWKLQDGQLTCGRGKHNRIELPYRPPEEYDFLIEFTRHDGDDVNQVLTHRGKAFIWEMGGFENSICGFDIVGGKSANENPASARMGLENNRRYTSLVQIRKDGMKAFIDGKLVSEYKTDWSDVEIYSKWKLRDNRLIGLATHSPATFHRIEVFDITGKGTFTR
ncbi:MAG TPA: serine/threonine-protein kinase [Planctomycetota bacterium]|nr:serine/threonine-protein kinase [Planctomycetota bacterium]